MISEMNNHKHSKHEVDEYDCDQCDDCPNLHGISQEIITLTSYCYQCDDTFNDKNRLNNHKHSKHEVVKYDCDQCDDCSNMYGMVYHNKSKHEQVIVISVMILLKIRIQWIITSIPNMK